MTDHTYHHNNDPALGGVLRSSDGWLMTSLESPPGLRLACFIVAGGANSDSACGPFVVTQQGQSASVRTVRLARSAGRTYLRNRAGGFRPVVEQYPKSRLV